jgi:PIN domain nuclease of toxin-antitoxin system
VILLDTRAWLWFSSDDSRLSAKARRAIQNSKKRAIAAVSCFEFAVLVEKGRIQADRDPLEWIEGSLVEHDIELLPLTPAVAVRATQLGNDFHRDPADRQVGLASALSASEQRKRGRRRLLGAIGRRRGLARSPWRFCRGQDSTR